MDEDSRLPYRKLSAELHDMPRQLGVRPRAVLVISAHWEEPAFTLTASSRPPMIYDYGGFPEYTYRVRYDAPGDPDLAARTAELISGRGLPARLDPERGFDHGLFTPFHVIYPEADVAIVQLSLRRGLDAEAHLELGRAIAPLREDNVLIVGSGLSYHNLRQFFSPAGWGPSREFDAWLQTAVVASQGAERCHQLVHWEAAPAARAAHPREEHLLPLMVAVGAAEHEPAVLSYHERDFLGGLTVSNFRLG
jgi:aromatic ring-opening dioxygenase catalytic subunit (LigB family)